MERSKDKGSDDMLRDLIGQLIFGGLEHDLTSAIAARIKEIEEQKRRPHVLTRAAAAGEGKMKKFYLR